MEYFATFGINGGVSHGFGIKYPDYFERTENIIADNHEIAFNNAMKYAKKLADDHLSDPETGLTRVRLLNLIGPERKVEFDREKAVVETTMLEHLLRL